MAVGVDNVPEEEEDRGAASESEAIQSTSMRCRLFGRSYDSTSSKPDSASCHSKAGSFSASASPVIAEYKKDKNSNQDKGDEEKEKDRDSLGSPRLRSKKSTDSTSKGAGERLSIFWSTFSGTLGKGRKPPPRYSAAIKVTHIEKPSHSPHSVITLPWLTSSSRKAPGHDRPPSTSTTGTATPKSTPKPTPQSIYKKAPVGSASPRDPALLRKRKSSAPAPPTDARLLSPLKQGQSILEQIGDADFKGWMRKKGDREGNNTDWVRIQETKIKGYVNIVGYKVTVDENVNPGRYGFRIEHDNDKTHYFSSDEKSAIRDWVKAIMKVIIGRDYTSTYDSHTPEPVISSCNIPTIPLRVAQAMNPAPRPPSPTARAATQKALRRENTNRRSARDARVLMGLPVPACPSREMRISTGCPVKVTAEDTALIEWANAHLPLSPQIRDATGSLYGGPALLRIAESVKGKPSSPPVLDSAFP
ncbi:hypothetical protein DXG01_017185 [Tephrocybe rancida]|nr:hypothetical protein DXG01_017185 [Tephrocybe rancida]